MFVVTNLITILAGDFPTRELRAHTLQNQGLDQGHKHIYIFLTGILHSTAEIGQKEEACRVDLDSEFTVRTRYIAHIVQPTNMTKTLQPLRLAGPLVFAFLLRPQGVLAELGDLPKLSNRQEQVDRPSIAIIGAGIGGCFSAYNLRQLLNDSVELHM